MSKISKFFVYGIVMAMFVSMLVPFSSSVKADSAQKPEWEVGDEWSMGYEKELDEIFSDSLENMSDQYSDYEDVQDLEYNLEGKTGMYQIYKVTDKTDDEYTMDIQAGGGFHAEGDFSMTGEMPDEGTYDEYGGDVPTSNKTVSGQGSVHFVLDIDGTAHFNRDDLALKDLQVNMTFEASADFEFNNYPMYEYDYQNGTRTVEYKDYDGGMSGEVWMDLDMEFDPYLDMFDFPIETGEVWMVNSEMTVSGTYGGEIDAHGLPEEFKENMKEDGYDTDFPMKIEDMDTDSENMEDGIIEESTSQIYSTMECSDDKEEIVLEDGSTTETYVIQEQPSQYTSDPYTKMHYSPEEGFIVSEEFSSSNSGMQTYMDEGTIEMQPKSESEAKDSMDSLQQMGGEEKGILGKLMSPPLIYLLIGVIVAVVAVAAVLMMKGGKKSTPQEYRTRDSQWNQPQQQQPQQRQSQQQPQQRAPQQQRQQERPPQQNTGRRGSYQNDNTRNRREF